MIKIAVISAISILGHCGAHLTLEHPKPYGIKTLNNSPLNKTGADFPCKQRNGVYEIAEMNNWRAGETQTVSFLGTAVHGGGSCQFSLTTDRHPTKDSRWKVVHSIVGGCPASVDGNLVPGQQPDKFGFTLSPDLPSGDYTFAWTWFNRRGYREMYMNCAPISVVGAPANDTFLTSLPDMFVANLPGTPCCTVEDHDFAFPDPGDSVSTGTSVTLAALAGANCVASPAPVDKVAAPAEGPLSVNLDAPAVKPTSVLGVATTISIMPKDPSPPDQPSSQISSVGLPSSCIPCRGEGTILCIDTSHFGVCNHNCATFQLLAAGTWCRDGVISKATN